MGLEKIGYAIPAMLAVCGLVGFIFSKVRRRPKIGPTMFALFVVGLAGLLFWSIFVAGLKVTLSEAIEDGLYTKDMVGQDQLYARVHEKPIPKISDRDALILKGLADARRSARLFGWSEKHLHEVYKKTRGSRISKNPDNYR